MHILFIISYLTNNQFLNGNTSLYPHSTTPLHAQDKSYLQKALLGNMTGSSKTQKVRRTPGSSGRQHKQADGTWVWSDGEDADDDDEDYRGERSEGFRGAGPAKHIPLDLPQPKAERSVANSRRDETAATVFAELEPKTKNPAAALLPDHKRESKEVRFAASRFNSFCDI